MVCSRPHETILTGRAGIYTGRMTIRTGTTYDTSALHIPGTPNKEKAPAKQEECIIRTTIYLLL